jgi:hypothetical protein
MSSNNFTIEQCWICGSKNNLTGEHLTKKSDLKM